MMFGQSFGRFKAFLILWLSHVFGDKASNRYQVNAREDKFLLIRMV